MTLVLLPHHQIHDIRIQNQTDIHWLHWLIDRNTNLSSSPLVIDLFIHYARSQKHIGFRFLLPIGAKTYESSYPPWLGYVRDASSIRKFRTNRSQISLSMYACLQGYNT
ncbi:uncharacterized protein SPPG_09573 [Spizellomyces punctatus DAOM BR117]|uniref:Uncharacterized protein n=1 Tax=Spizellomyces punctatus (strain DAOM BR117) TaxID=645134 RepID=A0A0L0H2Y6_SPIPD|nr:hypothetical protein, variant [Spizellomyces punctatus DAOM BR117]XP_016603856.1 uncharacterized protein SPPG_09573 [Spizellomyces punctatus DAOM BR117]KNC95815.1 hypothetical protein, variant [Spizellomyces punctatus DAOM BR117]KNC95816.1 hypothetical protein SPPG_09573 [Spizellomyces punctatus DAOM BR117]|eukprot:XP_016603855.1 hypothetical protein, variant [Spizellomyces punctatus DAOM BR117]